MIEVDKLSVQLGEFSLRDVSLQVETGQYGILMGRTGSGKTTVLETICGLRPIVGGTIRLMGRDVTHLKPAQRGIGFVPQEGALFVGMTVRDQIGFALTIRKRPKKEVAARVDELAELLAIGHLLDRKPAGLSGGEKQRVALGRALAARPGVLCLDEPLSALDEGTRQGMYALLKSIQQKTGVTTLHITHSQSEARRLGDTVFWVHDGTIEEVDDDTLTRHIGTADLDANGDSPDKPLETSRTA